MARKMLSGEQLQPVLVTVPEEQSSRRELERLELWHDMASLMVFKGCTAVQAYRAVSGNEDARQMPTNIAQHPEFRAMVSRLRSAQGLSSEAVQGTLEGFYRALVLDETVPLKQRLQAAAQWQKLRGLERKIEESRTDDSDMAEWLGMLRRANKARAVEVESKNEPSGA